MFTHVIGAVFSLLAFAPLSAFAQAPPYPTRPIKLIVPFPAGGTSDVLSRAMARRMEEPLGQSVIIENVSGADGSIGIGRFAVAPPDGYTLGLGQWGTYVVNGAMYKLSYDVTTFEPIALVTRTPLVLYANKSFSPRDIHESISWMKAHPGEANHGNATAGLHALAALFQKETGTKLHLIPYRGEAPATQDLIAGIIQLMWNSSYAIVSQVNTGNLKAYVTAAKERLKMAPNIPTVAEAGYPGLTSESWYGFFAPHGTPSDVIAKLNHATMVALADTTTRQRIEQMGLDFFSPQEQTPAVLGERLRADMDKWWPIIKEANIRAE